MTTPAVPDSNVPALPDGFDPMAGLEDLEASDLTIPRIQIEHKEGVFVDSQSKEKFSSLRVIILGLVKQRVLWEPEVDNDAKPLCRSYNHTTGHANAREFPWAASGFNPADFGDEPVLDCGTCPLKDWDTHPTRKGPWCTEQFVFPVLVVPDGGGAPWPAIFTTQRSGVKDAKTYISSFVRSQSPMFTSITTMTLDVRKRGNVDYAVPQYAKGEATDSSRYGEYAQTFYQIRDFISTPYTRRNDEPSTTTAASTSAPAPAPAPAPAAPAPAPAPVAEPVTPAPAPSPEPAPPAAAPVESTAPAPVEAAAPAPAAPAPAAPVDDEIPF